jgi:hypothetical protein
VRALPSRCDLRFAAAWAVTSVAFANWHFELGRWRQANAPRRLLSWAERFHAWERGG